MRTVKFETVLKECALSQNVNPATGSYTAEYAQDLAESISNRVSLLWTQEFWPFVMKTERRQFRPSWLIGERCAAGDERYYDGAYYRSMIDDNIFNTPGEDDAIWKEVLSITSDDVEDYLWDPFIGFAQPMNSEELPFKLTVTGCERSVLNGDYPWNGTDYQFGAWTFRYSTSIGRWGFAWISEIGDPPEYDDYFYNQTTDSTLPPKTGWIRVTDAGSAASALVVNYELAEQAAPVVIPEDGYELDEFLFVENPVINQWARPIRDVKEDDEGVHVVANSYPVRPWVRFRPAAPRFSAFEYDADEVCSIDAVRYDVDSGECYRSLIDGNRNNAVTDETSWEKQLFPKVFLPAVRLYAKAERKEMEEQFEAAGRFTARADQLVDKLTDDFFEAGGRTRRARIKL